MPHLSAAQPGGEVEVLIDRLVLVVPIGTDVGENLPGGSEQAHRPAGITPEEEL